MYFKPNLKRLQFAEQLLLTMKLTAFFLLVFLIQLNAESLGQTVSLKTKQAPLTEVLKTLQRQTGYAFMMYEPDLRNAKKVDLALKNVTLEEALRATLKNQSISYTITDDRVVVLKKIGSEQRIERLLMSVGGTVVDSTDMPLPGVKVAVKNTAKQTSTNTNGRYELEDVNPTDTLVFTSVGFHTVEMPVNGQTTVSVQMQTSLNELDAVVVVGYGTQRKTDVTASISTLKGSAVNNRPVSNVITSLQGQMPGVFIQEKDAMPIPGRRNVEFNIRGTSTLSSNPVLVLIDGVPGDMENLNPNDIDNISVLKDAAATAIYGARASGGVILVTTKQGQRNSRPILSYDGYIGIQNPTYLPKMVDAPTFMNKWNESMLTDNPEAQVRFTPDEIAKYASGELPSTDWVNEIFQKNALQTQHNFSVNGGAEKVDYFVSLAYLDQKGAVDDVRNQRFSSRARLNVQLLDNMKLGINTQYTNAPRHLPGSGYTYYTAMSWAYILSPLEWPYTPAGQMRHYRGGSQPLAILKEGGYNQYNDENLVTNLTLDYELAKNLVIKGQYAYSSQNIRHKDFAATYRLYDDDEQLVTTQQTPNALIDDHTAEVNQSFIATVNYDLTFNENRFKFLGGFSRESSRLDFIQAGRKDFLNNDVPYLNAGSSDKDLWTTGGSADHWAIQSWFGRLNYSLKDRYLLEVNARYDGSSRFLSDKWGFFPSVSAGWRLSEEYFLKDVKAISNLKLRASYGKVGNQNAGGLYPWASTIGTSSYFFNNQAYTTTFYANSPNPNITWEEKNTFDIGLDAGFLDEKFTFTADFYREITTGILRSPVVPTTFGRGAPEQNVGKMRNIGWELSAGYQDYTKAFKYAFRLNLYDAKNKILDMGGTPETIDTNPLMIGQSRWVWYGYEAEGLYQSAEEVANSPTYKPQNGPGDIKYKDQNNDGKITPEDRILLGDAYAHYMFGFNANFIYKNFDLTFLLQGVLKNKTYLNGYAVSPFNYGGSFTEDLIDSWTPENTDARFPVMRQDQSVNYEFSNWWLFNSAYLRVKNLQVGYTFPDHLLKRLKVSQLRIYASIDNLLTLKAKEFPNSFDPEIDNWQNGTNFPQMQTATLGLNIKF